MSKFKRKPQPRDESDFIADGGDHIGEPWAEYLSGKDGIGFNLRFKNRDFARLKWYFENYSTEKSLQKLIMNMVLKSLDDEIDKIDKT